MNSAPDITLLFDGLCPVCAREIALLRRLDGRRRRLADSAESNCRLAFVDITDPSFDPARHGLTMPQVIGAMHGILPDGSVVVGVEVFRRAYRAVGLGWLLAWTNWPLLRPLANAGYRLFARVRPRLSRFTCEGDRCAAAR
ncbi:MAG: DUF393 domain-containing protein [Phycisphaerales bacterium]|jgi:predicted DCC family thiol-disulfide oxidoreductase YuxK